MVVPYHCSRKHKWYEKKGIEHPEHGKCPQCGRKGKRVRVKA